MFPPFALGIPALPHLRRPLHPEGSLLLPRAKPLSTRPVTANAKRFVELERCTSTDSVDSFHSAYSLHVLPSAMTHSGSRRAAGANNDWVHSVHAVPLTASALSASDSGDSDVSSSVASSDTDTETEAETETDASSADGTPEPEGTPRAETVSLPVVFGPALSLTLSATSIDDADADCSVDGHPSPCASTPLLPPSATLRKRTPAKSALKTSKSQTLRPRPSLWSVQSLQILPRRNSSPDEMYTEAPRPRVTFAPRATYLTINEGTAPSWVRNCARTTRPVREGVYTLGMRHMQEEKQQQQQQQTVQQRQTEPEPVLSLGTKAISVGNVTIKGIPFSHLSASPRTLTSLSLSRVSSPGITGLLHTHDEYDSYYYEDDEYDERFEYRRPLGIFEFPEKKQPAATETIRRAKAWLSRKTRRGTA